MKEVVTCEMGNQANPAHYAKSAQYHFYRQEQQGTFSFVQISIIRQESLYRQTHRKKYDTLPI